MKPIDFPQATGTLSKPSSMTDEECAPLRVCVTDGRLLSCWKPTWKDRIRFLFGCPLWLWVAGRAQPPVALETEDPFASPGAQKEDGRG